MEKKSDIEFFSENVPAFKKWYTLLLTWIYHFLIFLLVMIFFWWISSNFLLISIPAQFLIASGSTVPFMYIAINFDNIRKNYLEKYKKNPWQHFWYHYSYTSPLGCAALYYPLLIITQYNIPITIARIQDTFITRSLIPVYISIPLGFLIILFGIFLVKPSQSRDRDMDVYLRIMEPQETRIPMDGIYKFIRHPRFLSRLILSLGLATIANNLLAFGLSIVHFIPYYILLTVEDKQIAKRYNDKIRQYQNEVPAIFPRFKNLKEFFKLFFIKN